MNRTDTTLEQFKQNCPAAQYEHIDITKAPSYASWYKCALRNAKRQDAGFFKDGHNENRFLETCKSLGTVKFDLSFGTGKTLEYARVVVSELGLHPRVNCGKFKGTDFLPEELYARLPL